jgi:stage V sporulation protein B
MSRKESLVRGAAALAAAGLLIKISNLAVRVPLTRMIGSESLGIYQMALPAFWALFHLAAGGVPVAVQNLVAEYTEKGRRSVADQVLRIALSYTFVAGGLATMLLLAGAPLLAKVQGEPRAYWPLVALAPAVFLSAIDLIYRSYLQGRKLMTPSANASVLEQIGKITITVVAAYLMMPYGKDRAAAGAAAGITAGYVISLVYIMIKFRQIRLEDEVDLARLEPRAKLVRRMVKLAWPVTIGSVMLPILSLVDVGIVQRGFQKAGHTAGVATAMYGAYQGIAVQVCWFPVVLTNALGNALVPVLAAAKARKDQDAVRERVLLGLRATGLICLPVALGIAMMARPIAGLFGDNAAIWPLLYMAPVAFLGPLAWMMTAQLQALGRTGAPMRNFSIAWLVKMGLDYLLAPMPGVDIRGVSVASVLMFFIACGLNARELERELGEPLPWGWLLRGPLVASVTMAAALFGLAASGILPNPHWAALSVVLVLSPVLYSVTLGVTGAVTWQEVRTLTGPVGARLERWFQAFWTWG